MVDKVRQRVGGDFKVITPKAMAEDYGYFYDPAIVKRSESSFIEADTIENRAAN